MVCEFDTGVILWIKESNKQNSIIQLINLSVAGKECTKCFKDEKKLLLNLSKFKRCEPFFSMIA